MMDTKKILLINDLAGYGKVALSVMFPILSHMEYELFNLPTALVSNTLDYGKFHILETTEYMRESINVWNQLGFSFDAVCTGFLVSEEQTKLVYDYCMEQKQGGTPIFVDPIMGDNGKLYNGVTLNTIQYMRNMCEIADIIMPNMTEAAFLAGMYEGQESVDEEEAKNLLDKLKSITNGSVIITSLNIEGTTQTLVYDAEGDVTSFLPYNEIPVRFPGTGDIFSSVVIGNYLAEKNITESAKEAMTTIEKLIEMNKDNADKYKGIPIEMYLSKLRLD